MQQGHMLQLTEISQKKITTREKVVLMTFLITVLHINQPITMEFKPKIIILI